MSIFGEKLKAYFEKAENSLYKVALSVDLDPTNTRKILYGERVTTFEKRLELLQKIAESPLMTLDIETMAAWLAMDYLSKDAILQAAHEVEEELKDQEAS